MRTVIAFISRSPEACWRVITDPDVLTGWVPGLRRTRVVHTNDDGLPAEIQFEFSSSLTYSLVYTYHLIAARGQPLGLAAREIRWEPRAGKRDGVRGFARFEPFSEGTRLTYALEQGDGRSAADLALGDLDALVASFVRWTQNAR